MSTEEMIERIGLIEKILEKSALNEANIVELLKALVARIKSLEEKCQTTH